MATLAHSLQAEPHRLAAANRAWMCYHIGARRLSLPSRSFRQAVLKLKKARDVADAASQIQASASRNRWHYLVVLDRVAKAAEFPVLMRLLVEGVPIVVSRHGISDGAWSMKTQASRFGARVEVAESDRSLPHMIEAAIASMFSSPAVTDAFGTVTAPQVQSPVQDEPSRTEQLGSLPGVIAATAFLRSGSGRLDAEKIRELFGLTRADIRKLAGGTDEAIRQTPDSPRLQPVLLTLERIARLLVLNPDPVNFRKWLNTTNSELGEITPLDGIKSSRADMVADLVEDVLTNRGG